MKLVVKALEQKNHTEEKMGPVDILDRMSISFTNINPHDKRINFDGRYQRKYGRKQHFPSYLPEEIVLSIVPGIFSRRADGSLWGIDAKHRVTRARELGVASIPSIIVENLTEQEEALIFSFSGEAARKMTATELFRSRVFGQEDQAVAIQAMMRDEGIDYREGGRLTHVDNDHTFTSMGHAFLVVNRWGTDLLRRSFHVLRASFPEVPGLLEGWAVFGMAVFLNNVSPLITDEEIVRTLQTVDYDDVISRRYHIIAAKGRRRGHLAHSFARALKSYFIADPDIRY